MFWAHVKVNIDSVYEKRSYEMKSFNEICQFCAHGRRVTDDIEVLACCIMGIEVRDEGTGYLRRGRLLNASAGSWWCW